MDYMDQQKESIALLQETKVKDKAIIGTIEESCRVAATSGGPKGGAIIIQKTQGFFKKIKHINEHIVLARTFIKGSAVYMMSCYIPPGRAKELNAIADDVCYMAGKIQSTCLKGEAAVIGGDFN